MRGPSGGDDLHSQITTDTVIHMHHKVTRAQRLGFGEEIIRPPLAFCRPDQAVTQNVLLGDNSKPRCLEPVLQRPNGKVQTAFADAGAVGNRDRFAKTLVFDKPGQPFPGPFGIAGDDHRPILKLYLNV